MSYKCKDNKCATCEHYICNRKIDKHGYVSIAGDNGHCAIPKQSYHDQVFAWGHCSHFSKYAGCTAFIEMENMKQEQERLKKQAQIELDRQKRELQRMQDDLKRESNIGNSSSIYSKSSVSYSSSYATSSSSSYSKPSYSSSSTYSSSTAKSKTSIIGIIIVAIVAIGIIVGLCLVFFKPSNSSSNSSSSGSSSGNYNGGSSSGGSSGGGSSSSQEINYYQDGVNYLTAEGYSFKYVASEDGYLVGARDGRTAPETFELPTTFQNKPVVGVKSGGFSGQSKIKYLTIPSSYKYIGQAAFYECDNIETISLPAVPVSSNVNNFIFKSIFGYSPAIPSALRKVTITAGYIGNGNAFNACSNLTDITICEGVEEIGNGAFLSCSGLTNLSIPSSVNYIGENAFKGCSSLVYNEYDNAQYLGNSSNKYLVLVKAKNTSITSCQINSSTKFIYRDAFLLCSSLTELTIPSSVTNLDASFAYCSSLTTFSIPEGATTISSLNYNECSGLTSFYLPLTIKTIKQDAFSNCTNLKTFYYNGTISDWAKVTKEANSVYSPNTVNVICSDGTVKWND